jgi:hypothetical protein
MENTNTDTATGKAAQIRQTLKGHGWTSRDVSVRADYFSMGSAIRVTIKNPAVPLATVKAIATEAERIDRCEITGDILAGGNRYVSVSYTREACAVLEAQHIDAVREAAAALAQAADNYLIPVAGTPYLLGRGRGGYGFAVWDGSAHRAEVNDEQGAARWIGVGGSH